FIPSPNVTGDHQYYNAKEFSDAGAAILAEQKDFNADGLAQILTDCFEKPKMIETMSACAKKAAIVDSASRLADALEKI
ncbi:MAG: UDP-N-acetylglucosamine--N-acetylmuramyl-(pentapeptide) pyrophosphoryl-undecaprenol N-acetylglucosamine transferase, partial [Alphaproteobacteria bacterium]|nr:UDP-N-acetylglucosamine--N-acetylmuramyl-(pentapeptide) pyrophosphoryl-undecaprenol N-acetylglucosamine transferase [Alphaproteobacteria bacterium]